MALYCGAGRGWGNDAKAAGENAARDALKGLGSHLPEVAIVFASSAFDQDTLLAGIVGALPDVPLVGCSAAAVVTSEGVAKEASVAVLLLSSDRKAQFSTGESLVTPGQEREAGAALAQAIQSKLPSQKLAAMLLFPDALSGNNAEVLRGAAGQMGNALPIAGAAAGDDNFQFSRTYQYLGKTVSSRKVVALGISKGLKAGIGAEHGWRTIGLPMTATKTEGAMLAELDGKPAIAIYEKYFGELSRELREEALSKLAINYPLGIRISGSRDVLIRTPLSVDDKGGILCGAEIPQGTAVRLMIGSGDSVIEGARKAALVARQALGGKSPEAAIIISSVTRKKLLGERIGSEIIAIRDVLGSDVPLIGMYGYGEFAPLHGLGEERGVQISALQNQSIVVVALCEA